MKKTIVVMLLSMIICTFSTIRIGASTDNSVSSYFIYNTNTYNSSGCTLNGFLKDSDGVYKYFKNCIVDTSFTGIAKNKKDNNWYFVKNGYYQKSYTGIAKNPNNNKWFYVKKGSVDFNYTGIAKRPENGNFYYVKNGQVDFTFTGVAKNPNNGKWFYIENGQLNWNYIGPAINPNNNQVFYVVKGQLDLNYSGTVEDKTGTYLVNKGKVVKTVRIGYVGNNIKNVSDNAIVYYVDGTNVYHTHSDCRHLKNSKNIYTKTFKDAKAYGHTSLCKTCEKR